MLPAPESQLTGSLLQVGEVDWYRLDVSGSASLAADLTPASASSGGLRLTLALGDGQVLATSEGLQGNLLGGSLKQHLPTGSYYLGVSGERAGAGYELRTALTAALSPVVPLSTGQEPLAVAEGDLDRDGRRDLIAVNSADSTLSLYFGNGDGSFRPPQTLVVGAAPAAVLVVDVDRNGWLDLVTANRSANNVSVLLQNPDGGFQTARAFAVGVGPAALVAAHLNGDQHLDLAIANQGNEVFLGSTLTVLRGDGQGNFVFLRTLDAGLEPSAVLAADVTGDGLVDLLCASRDGGTVDVLSGDGQGHFQSTQLLTAGSGPSALALADLNGDLVPDLVCANRFGDTLNIFPGGATTFGTPQVIPVGDAPVSVAASDLNGDGFIDLVCANANDSLNVLLGSGQGQFLPRQEFPVGSEPTSVCILDANADDLPDLVSADANGNQLFVLLGNGDGSFVARQRFLVGAEPRAAAIVDLNNDGRADLVSADGGANGVSVLLGNGDGTFQVRQNVDVGRRPVSVAWGDLNSDGRQDLVTANINDDTVTVLLGNGDGTFASRATYAVGSDPQAVIVLDLNGDGQLDLVTADSGSDALSVFTGVGAGLFGSRFTYRVGEYPLAVTAADLNGDGHPDLISADRNSGTLSVLSQDSMGGFHLTATVPVGDSPVTVVAADFDADGRLDLAAGKVERALTVHLRTPAGGFASGIELDARGSVFGLVAVDVDGDRTVDLVYAELQNNTIGVARGLGGGAFAARQGLEAGNGPNWLATGDVNNDGRVDLVTVNSQEATLGVRLGASGALLPIEATPLGELPLRNTPHLADFNGDGMLDSVVLDRSGVILYRPGLRGQDVRFGAPVRLNPDHPVRDIVPVRLATGWAVAALATNPVLSSDGALAYAVVLYAVDASGRPLSAVPAFTLPFLATRIAAGVLDGSGRDALVVAHALDDRVSLALPGTGGVLFADPLVRATGATPADIRLADLGGDGLQEVLVGSAVGADVTVLTNDATHSFVDLARFRAGAGLYGLTPTHPTSVVSLLQPSTFLVGDFVYGGGADVTVLLHGTRQLAVLENNGRGGLRNPNPARGASLSDGQPLTVLPNALAQGDFDGDGRTDVALLQPEFAEVWVFRGLGDGRFEHTTSLPLGGTPSGLNVLRNTESGQLDLLVGNSFGDLLILTGQGDGTFLPPPPFSGRKAPITVGSVTGDGTPYVLLANQSANGVVLLAPQGKRKYRPVNNVASGEEPELAPGAVQFARLQGPTSPFLDTLVLGTGRNEVLIYRTTALDDSGRPLLSAPRRYSTGTRPTGLTVADVSGDTVLDLIVVNEGSNDVSVLFGAFDAAGHWVATPGPRLRTGGANPVAVSVSDVDGDGLTDLVVTNGGSGTVSVIPGRGQGFFDDRAGSIASIPVPGGAGLGPISLPTDGAIALARTGNGGIASINLNTLTSTLVFSATPTLRVQDLQSLSGGDAIVVFSTGTVAELGADVSGLLSVTSVFESLNGQVTDPSSLTVIDSGTGLQALVSAAGEDVVFVFIPVAPSGPITEITPAQDSSLALVVTLLVGAPLETEQTVGDANSAEEETTDPALDDSSTGTTLGGARTGNTDEEGLLADARMEEAPSESGIDLEEKLKHLDLTPESDPSPAPETIGRSAGNDFFRIPDALFAAWHVEGDSCRADPTDLSATSVWGGSESAGRRAWADTVGDPGPPPSPCVEPGAAISGSFFATTGRAWDPTREPRNESLSRRDWQVVAYFLVGAFGSLHLLSEMRRVQKPAPTERSTVIGLYER